MRSRSPKVAHPVLGVPMVRLVVAAAREAGCERVVLVTGHHAEKVEELVEGETCVRQEQQLGTGHAVMCAADELADFTGSLVVLAGDTPLMRPETIRALIEARESSGAAASVLTALVEDPTGYGRIVRGPGGQLRSIVEQKDLEHGQETITEVNTSTYCFDARLLFSHLQRLGTENAQGEYYLTDMVAVFRAEGLGVEAVAVDDPSETMGINTRVQLAEASRVLQRRINTAHMLSGVTMTDPELVWIGPEATLGRDVVLEPMTFLYGSTTIADGARIGPDSRVIDSEVGEDAVVDSSVVLSSVVGAGASVGPSAYLRPGTVLQAGAKVGTHVEVKNSVVGARSKVPHLSYIGDATIGEDVNVGAGSITCNYDGFRKHKTAIGDGAFIGSDTMLVAPVTVGPGAVTGAGSAISRDVPAGSLAVERSEQRVVEGWAEGRRRAAQRSEDSDKESE